MIFEELQKWKKVLQKSRYDIKIDLDIIREIAEKAKN
jgi:hypothetical protein